MKDCSPPFYTKKKIFLNVTENTVIDILLNSTDPNGKKSLSTFYNAIYFPFPHFEFNNYKGFYVTKNILRQELKLAKGKKPGDIDILLIPFDENKIFFERTVACEVKVVRPTRNKPSKNANSLGVTQLKGLINDGFPFVSLLHVSITEPLLENERMNLELSTIPINSGRIPEKGKTYEDYLINTKLDYFSWWSSDNQIKRLMAHNLPDFAGINCVGLDFYEGGKISWSISLLGNEDFSIAKPNPQTLPITILKVKLHFKKFQSKYIEIKL